MKRISYIIPIILYLLFAFSCTGIIQASSIDENIYSFTWSGKAGDFSGALNTKSAPNLLRKDQSPQITNFSTDEKLGLVKRDGYLFIDSLPVSTTTKILNTHVLVKDDGSSFLLVHVGSSVYSTSQLGTSWNLIKTGLSSKYPVRFATHYNKTFCSNGINTVFSTDGFISTEYSFIPKAFYPLSADGRLWMGSTIDNPSFVYFSKINVDPVTLSDWDITENAMEFGLGDGQIIKGLDYQKGLIWPYKEHSSYGIRSVVNKYLALSDYGTVSQFSINGYGNGKIFLDKSGFYYFAGGNVTYLSNNIDNIIKGIGLISANENRISITSNTDFSTGTFSNCYNNSGTVEISSSSKNWDTNADFNPATSGSVQHQIVNDSVIINTMTGTGYVQIPLSYYTNSGLTNNYNGNSPLNNGNNLYLTDNDDSTWVAPVIWKKGILIWLNLSHTTPTTSMGIKKIRVRLQNAIYRDLGNSMFYGLSDWWTSINIDRLQLDTYDSNYDNRQVLSFSNYDKTNYYPQNLEYIVPSSTITCTRIQLGFISNIQAQPFNYGLAWLAPLIYDISAYSYTTAVNYSSAVYVSPNFTGTGVTGQYQFLSTSDNLVNKNSTSSDTIKYYASNNASDWTYLGLSSGGYNNFAIPNNLDNSTNFYCKAELVTSSNTTTPTIYNMTLQYATTNYATYTSKVFSISKKITNWGSIVTEDEGTVTYQIRGATWNFGGGETNLTGTESTQWTNIINGGDITLSTSNIYVQVRPHLHTKNSKVLGINLTYSENPNSVGGLQEVASTNIDNRFLFACSTWTTHNDIVFVFNQNKAWEMWDNYPVASFIKFNNNYYFASSTQPIICKMYSGNSSVDAIWKTLHTDFEIPEKYKKLRNAYITTEPKADSFCYLEYGCDFSTFTVKTFVDLSSNLSRTKLVELQDGYFGQNFYFTISSTSTAKPEIQALKIEYQIYNR